MPQEITIDFSEQIAKVQTKIARLKDMIHDVRDQKIVLDDIKNNHMPRDTKLELNLGGVLKCSVKINVGTLIPLLEQNIEDNTALIHELAKELGIDIK
ncbi:DUF1359 domain-containing protein [Lactococcus lactis subsp. lactis]|jgi:hypothetical protein|uniref:Prophage pi2 protein 26 n=5 Tax=Lactococcus lactis TaxID=1358 RepID=Q9CGR3_LACLA|nr:DUF1359 domain-containing protein [Lactococcus lactis]NP_076609.1 DUF1359 domain-containing protein [Lactococcus phage bIL285]MRM75921.1 DUF1359 domain-containing protein [Lactococcus cremoris]AAK05131.1 prophage pi2 protein 26 [Lactococcus lactis subsp. lactis Il1403]AAK08262.1 Orf37 [Lactococcus phage bIL285]ARD96045.1 DUF1359 domain-containing protein [Lactococcus lactis subsp. lactis]ARE08274.1 DUF1359 domain-containing protein [Lactococcus lactis subsp. lactis]